MNRRQLIVTLAAASCASAARAQTYPHTTIRMVVPYSAGGGIDGVARTLAQAMSDELKQPIIIDNKPGAGGMLGAEAVAKAMPDGYTVLLAGNPELTITPWIASRVPYAADKDFSPIVLVAQSPNVLVANPSRGARTLREAIEAARKVPAGLSVGTPGNGTPQHIAIELLRAQLKIDFVHVPYKGAAPATVGVVGGETSFALVGAPPVLPHIAAGKLVPLAVTQPQRSPLLPHVPTLGEALGVLGTEDFVAWYGLLAPSKAPPEVARTLEKAALAALARADVKARIAGMGSDLMATPSQAFAERMRTENKRYGEIVKRFAIKA